MSFIKQQKGRISWAALFFAAGFLVGLPIDGPLLIRQLTAQALPREWRQGQHGLVNPLLGVNFPDSSVFSDLKTLQRNLTALVQEEIDQKKATRVSIYFKDQTNSHWTAVNQTDTFAPASLIKIPMMITYFKIAEEKPEVLKQQLQYLGPDHNTQEKFKPVVGMVPGHYYTIDNLVERMMVYSDNNALVMLFNHLDKKSLNAIFSDLAITVPTDLNKDGDYITPGNFSRFFRTLYNATYLSEEYSQKALQLMARAEFKEGLAAGVPAGTVVADKFGETPDIDQTGNKVGYELHDCGIIYAPDHPYILCVMTSGESYDSLAGVIKDISHLTYSAVTNNYK